MAEAAEASQRADMFKIADDESDSENYDAEEDDGDDEEEQKEEIEENK